MAALPILNLDDALPQDIIMQSGDTEPMLLEFTDDANLPLDIRGNTYRLDIYKNTSDINPIYTINGVIGATPYNQLTFDISVMISTIQISNYWYKVVVTYSSGMQEPIVKGKLTINF